MLICIVATKTSERFLDKTRLHSGYSIFFPFPPLMIINSWFKYVENDNYGTNSHYLGGDRLSLSTIDFQ